MAQEGSDPAGAAAAVVRLPAEIDAVNAEQVHQELAAALVPGATAVIVDMTATTFCDSMGVRTLARAYRQASANNIDVRFVTPGPAVLRILQITALDTVLRIYPSLDAALAGATVPDRRAPV